MTLWQVANLRRIKAEPCCNRQPCLRMAGVPHSPNHNNHTSSRGAGLSGTQGGRLEGGGRGVGPHFATRNGRCAPQDEARRSRGGRPMDARSESRYPQVYAHWQRDPDGFWAQAAREIDWYEPPKKVFDNDTGIYGRWFGGGVCTTASKSLRH